MAKTYEVVLHVSEENLGDVINNSIKISTLVSCDVQKDTPTKRNSSAQTPRLSVRMRGANGITGQELAMSILNSEPRSFAATEIAKAFAEKGFSSTSASPVLTKLVQAGKATALGHGQFCSSQSVKMSQGARSEAQTLRAESFG